MIINDINLNDILQKRFYEIISDIPDNKNTYIYENNGHDISVSAKDYEKITGRIITPKQYVYDYETYKNYDVSIVYEFQGVQEIEIRIYDRIRYDL